jgi:large subunit ribosomal protein L32
MAVPKKKTSKPKTDSRKAQWYNLAKSQAKKALSLGKSILTEKSTSFYLPVKITEDNIGYEKNEE